MALLSAGAVGFDPERTNRGYTRGTAVLVQIGGSVTDWLDSSGVIVPEWQCNEFRSAIHFGCLDANPGMLPLWV